jgi:hypothetical protein
MEFRLSSAVCVLIFCGVLVVSTGCRCLSGTSCTPATEPPATENAAEDSYASRREQVIQWLDAQEGYNGHVKKVVQYASLLNQAREEPADPQVVEIGALLHDCGYQIGRGPRRNVRSLHPELGAAAARGLLPPVGFDAEFTDHIARIVHAHHSVTEMDTPEWKVVWMADLAVNRKVKVTPDTAEEALVELQGMLDDRRKKQKESAQN